MPEKLQTKLLFPILLVLYEITTYLANDMYLPALPTIVQELGATAYQAQQTLTTWFFGTASMQLILGPISDRIGRRPALFCGGVVFVISTLVCALTTSIYVLLIARFFQGCAVCSVVTAGYSSIHETYQQKDAIHIIAIMGSIIVLAPAFGPLVGSLVLLWLDWRWTFGILAIWAIVALAALWKWMPESNPKANRQPLVWKNIGSNYLAIISNRQFMLYNLIFCFTFLGMIAWVAVGPFLVISKFKLSTIHFGIYQIMVFGSLIIGAQLVKPLMTRMNIKYLINLGLSISLTASIISVILAILLTNFLLGLVLSLMLFTFGSSLAFSPTHRIAIEASNAPMGARVAVFSTMMGVFGALGSMLVSITHSSLLGLALLLLIGAILAYLSYWGTLIKNVR